FPAGDILEGGANILCPGDSRFDHIPHTQRLQGSLAIAASRNGIRRSHGKPAITEEAQEVEAWSDCDARRAAGCDQNDTVAEKIGAAFVLDEIPFLKIIHPFGIR